MPKKAQEPQVEEQEEQEEVPQVPQEGTGKFEYIDGTSYEGEWHLFDGVKMKHGKGIIIHGTSNASTKGGSETYEGDWNKDLMHGEGTYLFTNGARYTGQWVNGKRHGTGRIEYLDGSSYEGEWEQDKMHGNGVYVDNDQVVWEGIFVDNTFESNIQKKLQTERKIMIKVKSFEESARSYFDKFFEAFNGSDKKTMKDNMAPFFIKPEELGTFVQEPYAKFEDKPADQWNEAFHKLIDGDGFTPSALTIASGATLIDPERILAEQLSDSPGGQIVEFSKQVEAKTICVVLCQLSDENWTIVHYEDKVEE
ncbi:unnamed protein product [Moneuplotes crassus]|uniref:Uncharacterized protein n=1 Tax=Euplotes crassus TaxID=5936 RepID=A0AAD1XLS5_EUPCR|nr:unnamed protein product [Moneuplotes crassus]